MREFFVKKKEKREKARVVTKGPLKETARGRTQEPFREGSHKEERWREKEETKEEQEKCKKSARTRWWSKIAKGFVSAFTRKRKEEEEEKKCRGEVRYTKARQIFSFFLLGRSMLGVSAAAEGSQRGAAVVLRMPKEMQF